MAIDQVAGGTRRRRPQAERNDRAVLDAARWVFMQDPEAPVSAVARAAGVGIGGIYRRYRSKHELLRTVCADGLRRRIAIADSALTGSEDPWQVFETYMRGMCEADVHALTTRLAGTFPADEELLALGAQADALDERVFRHARGSGVLRPDVHAHDIALVLEQISAIRLGEGPRTDVLRHRYLTLLLDGMRATAAVGRLPGPPPTAEELASRWRAGQAGVR